MAEIIPGLPTILSILKSPSFDTYYSHTGAVDNFTTTTTGGNGTAVTNVAQHTMDLTGGIGVAGFAEYRTKTAYTLSSNTKLIINILVTNIVDGDSTLRWASVGMSSDFTTRYPTDAILVDFRDDGIWQYKTLTGGFITSLDIPNVVNGDIITFVLSSSVAQAYKNNVLLYPLTTTISPNPMYIGACAITQDATGATSRAIGIDSIGFTKYIL